MTLVVIAQMTEHWHGCSQDVQCMPTLLRLCMRMNPRHHLSALQFDTDWCVPESLFLALFLSFMSPFRSNHSSYCSYYHQVSIDELKRVNIKRVTWTRDGSVRTLQLWSSPPLFWTQWWDWVISNLPPCLHAQRPLITVLYLSVPLSTTSQS